MSGLVVSGLSVRMGGRDIVSDVSLTAAPAAITGLIGPNGAGKSSLMRAMLGLAPLDRGSVSYDGQDLLAMSGRQRAQIAGFVEQSAGSDARLTVRDVVMLGRIPFQSVWQAMPTAADDAEGNAALAAVDMVAFAGRLYHTLSGGEQQRVQIARALAQQPKLLVLDEPTSHLDVHAQLTALELLRRRARGGTTVVIALHDLNLAAAYCDSLVVMHHGRVAASGTPEEVLSPALLAEVYNVRASLMKHPTTRRPLIAYDLPD